MSKRENLRENEFRDFILSFFQENIRSQSFDKILSVLRDEFYQRPYDRVILVEMYNHLMVNSNYGQFANKILGLFIEITNFLSSTALDELNVPLFAEPVGMVQRIGECVDQVACAKHLRSLNLIDRKPVLFVDERQYKMANRAFLPYIKEAFEVLENFQEFIDLAAVNLVAPFNSMYPSYSSEIYGHTNLFVKQITPILKEKKIPLKPFCLKKETEIVGRSFFGSLGVSEKDQVVLIHLREPGYFDRDQHALRNSKPQDFRKAVNWLLSQGIKVVRIGHSDMSSMEVDRAGFYDLTKMNYPPEVDIYICAKAMFYFGTSSGPFSLADQFGTATLLFNELPYCSRSNSLVNLLKFVDKHNQKLRTIADINSIMGLDIYSANVFSNCNLIPLPASEDEILKTTKTMLDKLGSGELSKSQKLTFPKEYAFRFQGHLDESSCEIVT